LIGIKITCFLSLLVLDIVVNAGTVINCPIKNKWMLAPKKKMDAMKTCEINRA
jgi:hypothetical protein